MSKEAQPHPVPSRGIPDRQLWRIALGRGVDRGWKLLETAEYRVRDLLDGANLAVDEGIVGFRMLSADARKVAALLRKYFTPVESKFTETLTTHPRVRLAGEVIFDKTKVEAEKRVTAFCNAVYGALEGLGSGMRHRSKGIQVLGALGTGTGTFSAAAWEALRPPPAVYFRQQAGCTDTLTTPDDVERWRSGKEFEFVYGGVDSPWYPSMNTTNSSHHLVIVDRYPNVLFIRLDQADPYQQRRLVQDAMRKAAPGDISSLMRELANQGISFACIGSTSAVPETTPSQPVAAAPQATKPPDSPFTIPVDSSFRSLAGEDGSLDPKKVLFFAIVIVAGAYGLRAMAGSGGSEGRSGGGPGNVADATRGVLVTGRHGEDPDSIHRAAWEGNIVGEGKGVDHGAPLMIDEGRSFLGGGNKRSLYPVVDRDLERAVKAIEDRGHNAKIVDLTEGQRERTRHREKKDRDKILGIF